MIEKRFRDLWGTTTGQETPSGAFSGGNPPGGHSRHRRYPGGVRLPGQRHRRRQCQRQVDSALCGCLRLQGAGSGRQGLRAVHVISRLPAQTGKARGRKARNRYRVRLLDARRPALHAVAAFQGLESQLSWSQKRQPAGTADLSQDTQQPQQSVRGSRCAQHVAPEFRTAGISFDSVTD